MQRLWRVRFLSFVTGVESGDLCRVLRDEDGAAESGFGTEGWRCLRLVVRGGLWQSLSSLVQVSASSNSSIWCLDLDSSSLIYSARRQYMVLFLSMTLFFGPVGWLG